jgi:hypothetical protein
MKNLVIGLLVMGLANLGYSQQNDKVKEVTLETIKVTNINKSYLNKVQDATMSIHVKSLEDEVSRFDIKESPKFDGRSKPFKTIFKSSKGSIVATYDNKGKVLATTEKFKNVKLPDDVRVSVFKDHPNWVLFSDTYSVLYLRNKDLKKVYKVQIRNGNLKKNLKIDFSRNIIYLSSIENINIDTNASYTDSNKN